MSWFSFFAGACFGSLFEDFRMGRPNWWVWLLLGLIATGLDVKFGQSINRRYQMLLDASKLVHSTIMKARRPVNQFPEIATSFQFLHLALQRIKEDKDS